MAIHMGYMGWAKIGSTTVKITSASLNPVQSIEAPDLVQGAYVKKAYNYGKIETGGNIAGPVAEASIGNLWTKAKDRTADGDKLAASETIEIMYYKGAGRKFNECQINSFQISVTAGDVAQFTVDFMGTRVETSTGTVPDVTCEKLITWDKCTVDSGDFDTSQIQSFSFTIGNALQRIYKLNSDNLFPAEILAGIQAISGSVSFYAEGTVDDQLATPTFGADSWDDYEAGDYTSISFACGSSISTNASIRFHRPEANAQTGPAIYTVAFTGVCVAPS